VSPDAAALIATIVGALAGDWHNSPQYNAAPVALKVPPSVQGDWLDLQHASFRRIEAPAIGSQVLYLEWRSGGPTGPISRQRIWSFRGGSDGDADSTVRMDFYAFVDGKPFAGRAAEPGAFKDLAATDLRGYGPGCALRVTRPAPGTLRARITAAECSITAASGRRMGIDAEFSLEADGSLSYREAGTLEDGRPAFRVPPTMPYRFERLR
jgi:hypothetical protein